MELKKSFGKIFALFVITCFASPLTAQISRSQIYYYRYIMTKGRGVFYEGLAAGLPMEGKVYAILFAGNYMEYVNCGSITTFQRDLAYGSDYWERKVREKYSEFVTRYNNPPTSNDFALSQAHLQSPEALSLITRVTGQRYNSSLSDTEITTYTAGCVSAYTNGSSAFSMPKYWSNWSVQTLSFTFYSDLSKMLLWRTDAPNDMLVFERVDKSTLVQDLNSLKRNFK